MRLRKMWGIIIDKGEQTDDDPKRLKSALWFSIGKIVDEETLKLGVNATPQFIGALTEMVWAQIGTTTLFGLLR